MQVGLVALSTTWFVQGRTADSHQVSARALALASPGSSTAGQARFIMGGTALAMGRPAEGLRDLAFAAGLGDGMELLSVGTRANVHATAWGAHAHWLLGDEETATSASQQAIDMARAIGDPYNVAIALAYSAITHQLRHDLPRLREVVAELRDLCKRYEFGYYREWVLILDGWSGERAETAGAPGSPSWASATSRPRAPSPAGPTGCRCSPTCWRGRAGRPPPARPWTPPS